MKGTRPLDNSEIRIVSACFDGTFATRNRGLFMLGVSTGGRISELLSLTVGDVWQNQKPVTDLLFDKSIVKGGEISRAVPVNTDGSRAIEDLIGWHREHYGKLDVKRPVFPSRNGQGEKRMSRRTAHDVLKSAFETAGLNGKLATHSLRKSFAQRLYDQTGDIFTVQEMLGHKSVVTTQKYLGVNYASVRDALEKMSLDAELHEIGILSEVQLNKREQTQPCFCGTRTPRIRRSPNSANPDSANPVTKPPQTISHSLFPRIQILTGECHESLSIKYRFFVISAPKHSPVYR